MTKLLSNSRSTSVIIPGFIEDIDICQLKESKNTKYLRNHDFNGKKLLDVTNSKSVTPSVDPFFVHCQMD
jgi:hypothetical protein